MTFEKGVSGCPEGRPKGIPNKRTQLAKLLEPYAEELIAKLVELARGGDVCALRLCLERLIPKMQREPTGIEWPDKLDETSVTKLEADILQATLDSRITFDDAERLKRVLEGALQKIKDREWEEASRLRTIKDIERMKQRKAEGMAPHRDSTNSERPARGI